MARQPLRVAVGSGQIGLAALRMHPQEQRKVKTNLIQAFEFASYSGDRAAILDIPGGSCFTRAHSNHEWEKRMRVAANRKINSLQGLMDDDKARNQWVESECLAFYVRKGHITTRRHDATYIKPCLMVANFNVRKRKTAAAKPLASQMIDFMKQVEANAVQYGYAGVFVECVFNHRLRPLLGRFGYRQLHRARYAAPCYFKPTASISAGARYALRAIEELQRPSLRLFLRTPSIDRFWIREQNENVIMLVRRDRIGALTPLSRMRLTILDLHRYKVESDAGRSGHTLYWSDDEQLLYSLLQKLESRLLAEGFHELAIRTGVISTLAKTAYGGRTNEGVDPDAADVRMHKSGYDKSSGPGGSPIFVKSLNLPTISSP